jgi:hypothetical protein
VNTARAWQDKTEDDRLEDALHDWGQWKSAWRDSGGSSAAMISPVFRDVRSGYQTCVELLSPALRDLVVRVDAAIDDLRRHDRRQWIVVHWEYAPPIDHRRGAVVWAANGLPPRGSGEYADLLQLARAGVLEGLRARDVIL